MSDTTDLTNVGGNGLTDLAQRVTEARIEESNRELIARVLADLLASAEERSQLVGQVDQLRAELAEQQSLLERLRQENARLTVERDQYLRCLYALLPKEQFITTD